MLCGSIVAVIPYCLGFHIFHLFHAMNFTCCILPNFNVSIWCFEVNFLWTVATVLSIALKFINAVQWSTANFIKYSCWAYKSLSLKICFCTHSLVVDHVGCSNSGWISFMLLFLLSMLCSVHIQLCKLECFLVFITWLWNL